VRGHVGNHYNEMADVLAGEAARAVASGAAVPVPAPAPAAAPVAPSTPETEDAFTLF
jgi:ribonuclease HI